ncbi:MAG: hypothetical protein AB9919_06710 [Geobacteraceae bacterium]
MDDPAMHNVMTTFSDAERLRVIRAVILADLPLKTAFIMISRAALEGIKKSRE